MVERQQHQTRPQEVEAVILCCCPAVEQESRIRDELGLPARVR